MSDFILESDSIVLPKGAWAKTHRRSLRYRGRNLLAFTQGQFRPYLFPLYTPAGCAVTAESPADHPHHNSVWIAADHVHVYMPTSRGSVEEYTYNFYVNDVFQGRAPGRQIEARIAGVKVGPSRYRVTQTLEWRGPSEWAAPEGRVVLQEERITEVQPGDRHHVIDVISSLSATEWDVTIGPTRHAFFNARVAESMRAAQGGVLTDASGRTGAEAISGGDAEWVDAFGPVGGGQVAGIALLPHPVVPNRWWFVSDWGVLTTGPFREEKCWIRRGDTLTLIYRVVVHDGDARSVDLPGLYRAFSQEVRL